MTGSSTIRAVDEVDKVILTLPHDRGCEMLYFNQFYMIQPTAELYLTVSSSIGDGCRTLGFQQPPHKYQIYDHVRCGSLMLLFRVYYSIGLR